MAILSEVRKQKIRNLEFKKISIRQNAIVYLTLSRLKREAKHEQR